jgi:hypothetical protein
MHQRLDFVWPRVRQAWSRDGRSSRLFGATPPGSPPWSRPAWVVLANARPSIGSRLCGSVIVWWRSWVVARGRRAIGGNQAVQARRWLGFSPIVVRLLDFPCLRPCVRHAVARNAAGSRHGWQSRGTRAHEARVERDAG